MPASSAGSSRCFGRIGRLSSSRSPGANGSGKSITTVSGSVAVDRQRLARRPSARRPARCRPRVVDRLEGEHHIVGGERMAVGERDARPQPQGVAQAASSDRVQLSASQGSTSWVTRLTRTSRALISSEMQVGRRVAARVAVERLRLGADRHHQLTAVATAADLPRRRPPSAFGSQPDSGVEQPPTIAAVNGGRKC